MQQQQVVQQEKPRLSDAVVSDIKQDHFQVNDILVADRLL